MPFLVQFLQSDVSRTSCDGREWFPKAIEVLGTARPNDAHTSNEKVKARQMPRSAKTISDDGSLGRETMLSSLFTSHVVGPKILMKIGKVSDNGEGQCIRDPSGRWRGHAGTSLQTTQTRDTTKRISLSLSSLGEAQANILKHCYSVSFQEVAALTEALKELATNSELESKVVFCPGPKPFVTYRKTTKHVRIQTRTQARRRIIGKRGVERWDTITHDVGMIESTCISFPLTFFSRAGLWYNIACDVARCHLGGGISRGCKGEQGSGEGVGGRGGMDGSAAQRLARVHCFGGTCHDARCHVMTMMWGL